MAVAALLAASGAAAAQIGNVTAPPHTVEIAPGVYMPLVSLGTWGTSNPSPSDPSIGIPSWFAAGGNGIDCALDYQNQAAVRAAVKASGKKRSDLFITSKVCGPGVPPCTSASSALAQVQADIQQLGTHYVDLVLIHAPATFGPTNAANWKGLEQALDKGITKSIGVSNFNSNQLKTLVASATVKPAVNQCNMGVTVHDDATIKYCQANGITYQAYSAMKNCNRNSKAVKSIAAAHGKSAAQVCLRFTLDRGCTLAVGTGTNRAKASEYAKEDLDIINWQLTAAEMKQLCPSCPVPAPAPAPPAPAPPAPPTLYGCTNSQCTPDAQGVDKQTCLSVCK